VPEGRGTGSAIVICPGGGYAHLALDYEGAQVAQWLNSIGVAAFVLQYRLGPRYHHPIELGDAQRAIRTVRAKAAQYRVLPDRIGIMAFPPAATWHPPPPPISIPATRWPPTPSTAFPAAPISPCWPTP